MNTAELASSLQRSEVARLSVRVLVVGQTPPPYHGQSIMIKMLLDGELPGVELYHVRMAFSDNMSQVGRFGFGKLIHLFFVIVSIYYFRFRYGIRVLYYPPAGPNLVPLLRDIAILLSTRWLFAKTIFHFHACGVSELISRLPSPIQWLAKIALSRPAAAIQLSELTAADPKSLSARRIYTIPNAAHDEAERMGFERHRRTESKPLKLLYVGTVCEGKGVLVLLHALAEAVRAGKPMHLDIVGSFQPTEFREQVQQHIDSAGLNDHIHLWGQLTGDDKWQRFADADVFCFPTHYHSEGFPCVLLEAMCFSLAIVSTYWRGIPSIVKHGETGLLAETHDQSAIANFLKSLADDPDLCLRLGEAGRESFLKHFTVEKYIANLRDTFLDIGASQEISKT